MRVGIAGPIGTNDIQHLLDGDISGLPREMVGASLLVTLIERLIAMGHSVVAYTTDPQLKPCPNERVIAKGHNLTVHYVPRRKHSFRFDRGAVGRMADLFALERQELVRAMRADPPDIIHAHWSYEFGAAAIDSGLPCLLTCHDSPTAILKSMPDIYRVGRWIMARGVLRKARAVTVVSPYLVSELAGFLRTTPAVVPNPMPDRLLDAGRLRTGRDFHTQPPRLAMLLNGWTSRKNPVPGMLAMLAVQVEYPGAELHLYGPGFGLHEAAFQWATEAGCPSKFIFHGRVPHGEVIDALAGMDMLLHPSLEESFGMTLGEAMALGLPVVAGESSGAVPWVTGDGQAGALVDVRSDQAIAQAALLILGDSSRYCEASHNGLTRSRALFSSASVAARYVELYAETLRSWN